MSQVNLDVAKYIDPVAEAYPIFLLEFTHPSYNGALRICTSNVTKLGEDDEGNPQYGLTSNGNQYTYCPVSLSLPTVEEDGAPTCSLSMFRTAEAVTLLRSFNTRPTVNMYQIWSDDLNTIAASYPAFKVLSFEISEATIMLNIGTDMDDTEPFPGRTFANDYFGGVHR